MVRDSNGKIANNIKNSGILKIYNFSLLYRSAGNTEKNILRNIIPSPVMWKTVSGSTTYEKKIVFKWHERFRIATLYYFVKEIQVRRRLWQTVNGARYCRATYSFILQGAAHPYRRVNYGYIFLNFNANTGGDVENVNRTLDLDIKVTSRDSTLTSACFKSYIVLFFNVKIILSLYSCSWK